MKSVDKEMLKEAANKLMFDMEECQYDTLLKEFSVVIHNMELIGKIEGVDDATPMTFPFEVSVDYLREDEAIEPLPVDVALKNASEVVEGQIRLPKVVG